MAPSVGRIKTCRKTESEMQSGKNDFAVIAPRTPRLKTIPLSPTAACANVVRYGDSNAPATVVLKAEFAQSYMAQPKISCLSLIAAGALACFTAVIVSQVGFLAKGER